MVIRWNPAGTAYRNAVRPCIWVSLLFLLVLPLAAAPSVRETQPAKGSSVARLSHLLVEFSDDVGRPYAITPVPQTALLVLHYMPEAA